MAVFHRKFPKVIIDEKKIDLTEQITQEFITDLSHRIRIAKEPSLTSAYQDYLASRVNLQEAKEFVDPKLKKLKYVVNEYLKHG